MTDRELTDLDQLEKDIDIYHWSDVSSEELLRELVSRLRKAEKDADRYQWLRLYDGEHYETISKLMGNGLDAAIDAAMKKDGDLERP